MGMSIDIDDFHKRYMFHAECKAEAEFNQIIREIKKYEAIPKADYEARLKADMVAMLTDLQMEIEELDTPNNSDAYMTCSEVIQQKIDMLKRRNK